MFQYRGAGLDNIYLLNGYREIEYGDETALAVGNIEGLHKAIAAQIIHKPAQLTGQEFRFLRIEMDLGQRRLGELLGIGEQSIRQWEHNRTQAVSGPAERLMRAFASQRLLNEDGEIVRLLEELAELDHRAMELMYFAEQDSKWVAAERVA